jgi:serine protease inhibitor
MRRILLCGWLLLIVIAMPACRPVEGGNGSSRDSSDDFDAIAEPTAEARHDIVPLVKGNNAFALDLYARQSSGNKNLFFSPLSISSALGMTYAGARGETASQMSHTLHFDLEGDRLHAAFSALLWDLNKSGEKGGHQLHLANAIWADESRNLGDEFQELLKSKYGSRMRQADFQGDPTKASEEVNDWVNRQTHGKIKDIIDSENPVESDTRLLILNAIYFRGTWKNKFRENHTHKDTFYLDSGEEIETQMMHITTGFRYLETASFRALEMPYEGGDVSLFAFLPEKRNGLKEFEKDLTAAKLAGWIEDMRSDKVIVDFPRFKLETFYKLTDTLKQLGMTNAFQQGTPANGGADFTGMDERGDLYIGSVIHKAFVEVNEEGTEAAAVTQVSNKSSSSGSRDEKPPPMFIADHQFLFLIRDNRSGSILFLGRLMDPRG